MVDFLQVMKEAFGRTKETLRRCPQALLIPFVLGIVAYFGRMVVNLLPIGGFLSGLLTYFLVIALLTVGYTTYEEVITLGRLPKKILWNQHFFSTLTCVFFAFAILDMALVQVGSLGVILPLIIAFALQTLPEEIYLGGGRQFDVFAQSFARTRENYLHLWTPYLVYLILRNLLIHPGLWSVEADVMSLPLGVGAQIFQGSFHPYALRLIVADLLTGCAMIFRGHLFQIIAKTTKRSRDYRRQWS